MEQLKQNTMLLTLKMGKEVTSQVETGMRLWELEKAKEPISFRAFRGSTALLTHEFGLVCLIGDF